MDSERKLASVQLIEEIKPIPGADLIEAYRIKGWWVVDKKDAHAVGDKVVYFEVDSWIPHELAPFLSKGKEPKEYQGIKGERLRTIKLKKQLSQGLILPLSILDMKDDDAIEVGLNVTDIIGIIKWEPVIPAQLRGKIRGNFPQCFPKTDQERIQNLAGNYNDLTKLHYAVEEKLDGSSMTCYLIDGAFGVCSRNLDLTETEDNTYWRVANKLNIKEKLLKLEVDTIAIQGELVGPGIQGNKYKLDEHAFYVFDVYISDNYMYATDRYHFVEQLGLESVPVVRNVFTFTTETMDDVLKFAEGKSELCPSTEREGIVFKSLDIREPDRSKIVSFKAISNKFLLKEK